jgi:serine/threonine kinase 32
LTPATVNLNHFRLLRVVGKGAFGKVRIVERKDSGLTFALKYIRKDEGTLSLLHAGTMADFGSGEIRISAEHHSRTANVGAPQPSVPM